jgi:hypothetical protein
VTEKKTLGKKEKWCMNPDCALNNGQVRIWRTDRGRRGGDKGWCNACLKFEENQN